jgi:tRNA1(Val) A37 N6-methylase TrmN6
VSASPGGGIVRPARRPPGWVAPGPAPAGPQGRPELEPAAGEDLCFLVGDWRIFQKLGGHRWSMDDLVTGWLAARSVAAPPRRFLDIGCGIGSVLMSVAWLWPEARGVGIEAQEVSAGLCRRSLAYNGAAGRVEVRLGDLRDPGMVPEGAVFDLVTGTPPYFRPGTGTESELVQRGPCRFEHRGGVEDYAAAAARALAAGGTFVMCAAHGQAERVVAGAAAVGLHVHERVDVVPREGKAPLLCLHVLRRESCAAPPHRELIVRDANGQWTAAFRNVRRVMGLPA